MTRIKQEKFSAEVRDRNAKLLLYIAVGSMIMLFAGVTSGYMVSKAGGNWLFFELPWAFWLSTAVLLLSSLTMKAALDNVKKGNPGDAPRYLLMTLALGLLFSALQFVGWSSLVEQKVFFAGRSSNAAGSYLYVLTGLHLAHLAGGLIALLVSWRKSLGGKYTQNAHSGLYLTSFYWHFLDILWVYLFIFLLFAR